MGLTRISAAAVTDTDFKTSCKVATSTNISSFTATPNSIDGYTFSVGDRVLVKSQDNAAENGIYIVESVGTGSNGRWARAGDFRDNKGITNGAITFVERGTEANTFFFLGGLTSSVTVGSTALTFNSLVTETATTVIGSSQPNITSVGTLTSLAVTGNANVGNILAGGYFYSNGSPLTVDSTQIVNGNSNVVVSANGNISVSVAGNSNVVVFTGTGANINGYANITSDGIIGGNLTVTGNFTVNGTTTTLNTTTLDVEDLNITLAKGAASSGAANGAGITVDGANATFVYDSTSNTWVSSHGANITGTANITGNANVGNLGTSQVLASANVTAPQLISNIATGTAPFVVTSTTQVANLNAATAGSALTAGTVTTAAQPNITSVGTLSALEVTGNANVGNILAGGFYFSNGSPFTVDSTQILNGNSNVKVAANSNVTVSVTGNANIVTVTGTGVNIAGTANISGNITVGNILTDGYYFANGSPFSVDTTQIVNGNSNVKVAANSNVTVSVAGNANVMTITGTGANISGTANVTGNLSVGNVLAGEFYFSNGDPFTRFTASNTAPTSPLLGDLWYDTADIVLYVRIGDGISSQWLDISSSTNIFADITANTANITDNLTVGNNATINGTLTVNSNATVSGIKTDNYYYANGSPLSFGGANFDASATAPVGPSVGDYWYDTDTNILYLRVNDGTSDLWLDISTDLTARLTASATTPASAALGDLWYDTALDVTFMYINDGASNVWVDISSTGNNFASITSTNANITTATVTTANIGEFSISSNSITNGNSSVSITANANVGVRIAGGNSYVFSTTAFLPPTDITQDLGSVSNRWANLWGVASSALYADLAERYLADKSYSPGTVVVFGGTAEITVTNSSHDTSVAGVISTNPAYLMNDGKTDGIWLPVALTGRVPCQVKGPVKKGDIVVTSSLEGVAEKLDKSKYEPGCVIGKSLEDHSEETVKTIEVVVGRF